MSAKSVSGAFQKMHVSKKKETLISFITKYIDVIFRWSIPEAVTDMPPRGMYFVGTVANILALVLFCVLSFGTYESDIKVHFISPSEKSGLCTSVVKPITGTFLADTNGSWESNPRFDSSRAIYQFHFLELSANETFWMEMIADLQLSLVEVGGKMTNLTIDMNVLYWTTWAGYFNIGTTRQAFNLYSDPTVVFNREYVKGVVSNVHSDCNASSFSTYDVGSYILSTTYSFSEFMGNPSCNSVLDPFKAGFSSTYDGDKFTLSYDVRSLVTALAVNAGIIERHSLRPVFGSMYNYSYQNTSYKSVQLYNPRYPGMAPIVCLVDMGQVNRTSLVSNSTVCYFGFKNGSYGLPLFNSMGYAPRSHPGYCACFDEDGDVGPGQTDWWCDVFNFMSGYLIFNFGSQGGLDSTNPYLDMLATVPLQTLSRQAYSAMYIASSSGRSVLGAGYTPNTAEREAAYEFCNVGYSSCSIVSINTMDTNNYGINNYFYSLLNGSCSDSATIPADKMALLGSVPPAELEEPYYDCRKSELTVLSSAVGIAVGNMHAFLPMFFIIAAQLYITILYYEGVPPVVTYTKEERDDALKSLALQLLMMRDNRLPPTRSGALYKAYPHIHGEEKCVGVHSSTTVSGSSSSSFVGMSGGVSVLRLLTDELMENAYVNVYFKAESIDTAHHKSHFRKRSVFMTENEVGDVELPTLSGGGVSSGGTQQAQTARKPSPSPSKVTIFNLNMDMALDTLVEYGIPDPDNTNSLAAARRMITTIDSLTNRMLATLMVNAAEDFWEVSEHTAVLHRINLFQVHAHAVDTPSEFSIYIELLLKVYQLLHTHIRICYGCSAQEAHTYDESVGYIVGEDTLTAVDLEKLYNQAQAYALRHQINSLG